MQRPAVISNSVSLLSSLENCPITRHHFCDLESLAISHDLAVPTHLVAPFLELTKHFTCWLVHSSRMRFVTRSSMARTSHVLIAEERTQHLTLGS